MKNGIHYFLSSNSSRGFVSFLIPTLKRLDTVVRLDGWPSEAIVPLTAKIAEKAQEKELSVEWIQNCLDNTPTGIILPDLSAAVINIPLSERNGHNVCALLENEKIRMMYRELDSALACFEQARHIHDEWESIYISAMNFPAVDALAEDTIRMLLDGKQGAKECGVLSDRYFGAACIDGSVDYIPEITQDLPRRFFVKGRPGTGKSTFLKKIGAAACAHGFDAEMYHCALDPESMDMVVVEELGFCVFDSTAPHEYFPQRKGDSIIDIYEAAVKPGTDEQNSVALTAIQKRYRTQTAIAGDHLRQAHAALLSFYGEFFQPDSAALKQEEDDILTKIFK